jgi:hypothetical protein
MIIMVNDNIGAAVKNELRNYVVVKDGTSESVKLSAVDQVSFEGLDLSAPKENVENA